MEYSDLVSAATLAKSIGVSPSYITQLYRGTKPLNMETLAKMEDVLDIRFEIKAVTKDALELDGNNKVGIGRQSNAKIFLPATKEIRSRAV